MRPEVLKFLKDKNNKLINMVIERAKRDFPEDIAIIGLSGSFNTGDFYEKSDLDLIIINNTDRGWGISKCFILDDIGYDIYCTPWDTRIKEAANLENTRLSELLDMKVIYCAKPEDMEKLNGYRQKALEILSKPIGKDSVERAKKYIDNAKVEYTNAILTNEIGAVRYAISNMVESLLNAIATLNNNYFKHGIKNYLEEVATFKYQPINFRQSIKNIIEAKTTEKIRTAALTMLQTVESLYSQMDKEFTQKQAPTHDNICGIYEELWSNYGNKIIKSVEDNDVTYAYFTAKGIQEYLDEMTQFMGMKKYNFMKAFDPNNLGLLKETFLTILDEYLQTYHNLGRTVAKYETFEELYKDYMALK